MTTSKQRKVRKQKTLLFLEYFIGGVLLFSATAKLITPGATITAIQKYIPIQDRLVLALLILILSLVEFGLGLGLVAYAGRTRIKNFLIPVLLLFSAFLGVTLARYFSASSGSCGCFGAISIGDSPLVVGIRDLALYGMIAGLVIVRQGKSRMIRALPLSLFIISLLSVAYSLTNQHFTLYRTLQKPQSIRWYGFRAERVDDHNSYDLAYSVFGQKVQLEPPSADFFASTIRDNEETADNTLGYVVLLTAPVPCKNCGLFSIGAVFDRRARPLRITIEAPKRYIQHEWPSNSEIEAFVNPLLNRKNPTAFDYGVNTPVFEDAHPVGEAIVAMVNNMIQNLVIQNMLLKGAG